MHNIYLFTVGHIHNAYESLEVKRIHQFSTVLNIRNRSQNVIWITLRN